MIIFNYQEQKCKEVIKTEKPKITDWIVAIAALITAIATFLSVILR